MNKPKAILTQRGHKFEVLGFPSDKGHLSECLLVILGQTAEALGDLWPPPKDEVGGGIGCTCDDWWPD